jgi:ADP-heptose:LPS heptosyltransferase
MLDHVMFIAEGQLGDLLLLTPALRAVKESYPSSFLSVLVLQRRTYESSSQPSNELFLTPNEGSTSAFLRHDPHVDEVWDLNRTALRELSGFRRLRAELDILRWLRSRKLNAVICAFPEDRFLFWSFASGARIRVGERRGLLAALLTNRIMASRSDAGVLRYYCALAEAAGARVSSNATAYTVPPHAQEWAVQAWKEAGLEHSPRVVVVHPGASGRHRIWPPDHFAAVIRYVQEERRLPVVLCGSAYDAEAVEEVRKLCTPSPEVIMTGECVDYLAAILRRSVLCISNDSGPRHLAVALGIPSIAFFPKFGDIEWKVYDDELRAGGFVSPFVCPACPPDLCRNLIPSGERFGSYCLRAITTNQVIQRVSTLLADPSIHTSLSSS